MNTRHKLIWSFAALILILGVININLITKYNINKLDNQFIVHSCFKDTENVLVTNRVNFEDTHCKYCNEKFKSTDYLFVSDLRCVSCDIRSDKSDTCTECGLNIYGTSKENISNTNYKYIDTYLSVVKTSTFLGYGMLISALFIAMLIGDSFTENADDQDNE